MTIIEPVSPWWGEFDDVVGPPSSFGADHDDLPTLSLAAEQSIALLRLRLAGAEQVSVEG